MFPVASARLHHALLVLVGIEGEREPGGRAVVEGADDGDVRVLAVRKIVVVFIYLHSICFRVAEEFINTHYTHITHHSTPAASSLTVVFTQTSR